MNNLYSEINNTIDFSDLVIDPDLNDEEIDNNEQIIFANIKNYYVSDYDVDDNCDEYNKCNCKKKYKDSCDDDDDDESHDENSENCKKKIKNSCICYCKNNRKKCYNVGDLDCKRKDINLLDIDISLNSFTNLFYSNLNHNFNIDLSNRFNRYILFNYQFTQLSDNITERVDLTRLFKQVWCEQNELTLNSMPPEMNIRLTKETNKLQSLYFLKGTTVSLHINDIINSFIDLLKEHTESKKLKCILYSDIYMECSDTLIRLIWPYNVFLNTGNDTDLTFNDILNLEDV